MTHSSPAGLSSESLRTDIVMRYGVLLTLKQVADLLHRSARGLQWSLSEVPSGKDPFLDGLRQARLRIGRRVYFRAEFVALLLVSIGTEQKAA